MMNLTPFLIFEGDCAEAMAFYQSCLGGELTITKVADTPMKGQMPPEQHQKVVHACLKSGLMEFGDRLASPHSNAEARQYRRNVYSRRVQGAEGDFRKTHGGRGKRVG